MNSSQRKHQGYAAFFILALIALLFLLAFVFPTRNTPNLAYILGTLIGVLLGLLQISFIHEWLLHLIIYIDQHAGKVVKRLEPIAAKLWKFRNMLLVFILLELMLAAFVPVSKAMGSLIYQSCVQERAPLFLCGNGIAVTSMQLDEGHGNQQVLSDMNIGMIDRVNSGPFNQYDAINGEQEHKLEYQIFTENQACHYPSYGTLIIVTTLSQSVVESGLSSSVGLDNLRGAYLAQYNFDHEQNQFCLHLLIANIGTKGVTPQTVPIVMQQIRLYAEHNQKTFMGIVGFPFSVSVQSALYARAQISDDDLPIISPSAAADSFTDGQPTSPPPNFYTNFYRIVAPVTVEGRILADFMQNYSQGILTPTGKITVLFEDSSDEYSRSLSDAIFHSLSGDADIRVVPYSIGQPDSLNAGIDLIKNNQCLPGHQCKPVQIFFSGYANDLNILKNKLQTAREQGLLIQPTIRLIGGEGFYDLGSYNLGNYANLFFTMDASSDQVNLLFPSSEIPSPYRQCSGQTQPFNCEFSHFFAQVYSSDIYGTELAGMHVLLTYDAIQAYTQALQLNDGNTEPSLWQAISLHWSDVKFEGVSGKIQLPASVEDSVANPINKSIYVACTNNRGVTYIVAAYINSEQSPLQPTLYGDKLKACLQSS